MLLGVATIQRCFMPAARLSSCVKRATISKKISLISSEHYLPDAMKFIVEREQLLKPLQQVSGPLGGRPTLPILGNLLLQVADGTLSLTGTDLEMEMVARVTLSQPQDAGATTVPARKFFDICRGLPEGAEIAVQLEGDRILVRSGRSRFSLSTLPAADFPNLDDWQSEVEFTLPQATMKRLIEATQFSMAHQDVRYYL